MSNLTILWVFVLYLMVWSVFSAPRPHGLIGVVFGAFFTAVLATILWW